MSTTEDAALLRGCIMAALTGLAANPAVLSRLEATKRKKKAFDINQELVRHAIEIGNLTYSNIKGIEK